MAERRQKRVQAKKQHTVRRKDEHIEVVDPSGVWRQCSSIESRRGCDAVEHCEWQQRKGGTVEGYCGLDIGHTAEWVQGRCAVGSLPLSIVEAMLADLQHLGALPQVDYGKEREQLCETIALGLVAHALLREHGGNAREIDEDIRRAQRGWASWLPNAAAEKTLNDKRREAFRMLEDYRAERELDEGRPLTLRELVPDFVDKLRQVSPNRLWLWAVGGTALVALAAYLASRHGRMGLGNEVPIEPPVNDEPPLPVNEETIDVDGNPLPEMLPYQESGFGWKVPAAIGGGALLGAFLKIDPAEAEELRKATENIEVERRKLTQQSDLNAAQIKSAINDIVRENLEKEQEIDDRLEIVNLGLDPEKVQKFQTPTEHSEREHQVALDKLQREEIETLAKIKAAEILEKRQAAETEIKTLKRQIEDAERRAFWRTIK